ncbi:unnamed protein product, partial [Scytosiphon promiscuus]
MGDDSIGWSWRRPPWRRQSGDAEEVRPPLRESRDVACQTLTLEIASAWANILEIHRRAPEEMKRMDDLLELARHPGENWDLQKMEALYEVPTKDAIVSFRRRELGPSSFFLANGDCTC